MNVTSDQNKHGFAAGWARPTRRRCVRNAPYKTDKLEIPVDTFLSECGNGDVFWEDKNMKALQISLQRTLMVLVVTAGLATSADRAEAGERKKESTLTVGEQTAFLNALKAVKANGDYDNLVLTHRTHSENPNLPLVPNEAHRGPGFLAWHRQFLLELEALLQAEDATVTIPYWDWTVDPFPAWLGDGTTGDGCQDTVGEPFSPANGWAVVAQFPNTPCIPVSALYRNFGAASSLPTAAEVVDLMLRRTFDQANWNHNTSIADDPSTLGFVEGSFRNYLEGWVSPTGGSRMHNGVHGYVGGNMWLETSPDDPIFFLHHANIDRLWCKWQVLYPGFYHHMPVAGDQDPQGRPDVARDGHNAYDDLVAFGTVTAYDLINMRALGYEYDDCAGPCIEGGIFGPRTTSQILMDDFL